MKMINNAVIIIGLICLIIIIYISYNNYTRNSNAMVIVEPRKHKLLKYVCENYDANMPKDWDLYLFHGKSHSEYAKEAVKDIKERKVFLIPLDSDNLNAAKYNKLLKNPEFWNQVEAENILVFQTDSVLCSGAKYTIQDFLKYNYIGCATRGQYIGNKTDYWGKDSKGENNYFYGIGGLSFRKKSFMMKCIADHPNISPDFAEDVFFSNCVDKTKDKPENAMKLSNFCSQKTYESASFGVHKSWEIQGPTEELYMYCPEARALRKEDN